MKNVVGMSGGESSIFMARQLQLMGYDPVCLFADAGFEHKATYEFIRRAVSEWGLNAHFIRAQTHELGVGNTPVEISIDEIGYRPQTFVDHFAAYGTCTINAKNCTDRLKGTIMDKWKDEKFGKDGYVTWTGFRADETRRIKDREQQLNLVGIEAAKKQKKVNLNQRYLADISEATKNDIIALWKLEPFQLEHGGEHNGNCLFCIHKSCEKLALAARENPQEAEDWIDMVNSDSVRIMERNEGLHPSIQYRGYHSLESIIKTFKDFSTEALREALVKGKRYDTGSCSQSCDPTPQMSIFFED